MSELSTSNRALLRLIATHGPIAAREIAATEGVEDIVSAQPRQTLRSRLMELLRNHLIKSSAHYQGIPAEYSITAAGHRTVHSAAYGGGMVAQPRGPLTSEPHLGAELRPFAGRPGAMDAFALPSLNNGTRCPRVRPRLISTTELE